MQYANCIRLLAPGKIKRGHPIERALGVAQLARRSARQRHTQRHLAYRTRKRLQTSGISILGARPIAGNPLLNHCQ